MHGYWDTVPRKIAPEYRDCRERAKEPYHGCLKEAQEIAEHIVTCYPKNLLQARQINMDEWSKESFALRTQIYYDPPESGTILQLVKDGGLSEPLSKDYEDNAVRITCKQLALAGYHLADVLNNIYSFSPLQRFPEKGTSEMVVTPDKRTDENGPLSFSLHTAAFFFAIVFFVLLMGIAFFGPSNPSPFQELVYRVVLSLSAAAFAAVIPGALGLQLGDSTKATLTASGAIAVFVLVYRLNPARMVTEAHEGDKKRGRS